MTHFTGNAKTTESFSRYPLVNLFPYIIFFSSCVYTLLVTQILFVTTMSLTQPNWAPLNPTYLDLINPLTKAEDLGTKWMFLKTYLLNKWVNSTATHSATACDICYMVHAIFQSYFGKGEVGGGVVWSISQAS